MIRQRDGDLVALTGLLDRWTDQATGQVVEAIAIVTTAPNELMAQIHNGMPVLLDREGCAAWLDQALGADALELLRPCPVGQLEAYAVSTLVNRVANDGPEPAEPVGLMAEDQLTLG